MAKTIATNLFSRTWSDPAGNADGATVGDETLVVVSGALAFDGTEGIQENSGSERTCMGTIKTRQDPMTVWARVRLDSLFNASVSLRLRHKDADNYLAVTLRGQNSPRFIITERIAATSFARASYDGGYSDNTVYWVRLDIRGATIRARVYTDVAGVPGAVANAGLSDLTYSSLTLPVTGVMAVVITGDAGFSAPQMRHIQLDVGDYE